MVNKKIIKKPTKIRTHASASDWDRSSASWTIQTLVKVSPPSALRLDGAGYGENIHFICKNSNVLKLPYGRTITFFRHADTARDLWLIFRNIAAPGIANIANCYRAYWYCSNTVWTLEERVNNVQVRQWSSPKTTQLANTWYHFRLSWWLSWDIMLVSLDLEINGIWVLQGSEITITNPLFGLETYQRPGIGANSRVTVYPAYIDDTEIWEFIP